MSSEKELPWGYWVWPVGKDLTTSQVRKKAQEAVELALSRARKKWLEEDSGKELKALREMLEAETKGVNSLSIDVKLKEDKLKMWELDLQAWETKLAQASSFRREKEEGAFGKLLKALSSYFEPDLDARQIMERSAQLFTAYSEYITSGDSHVS